VILRSTISVVDDGFKFEGAGSRPGHRLLVSTRLETLGFRSEICLHCPNKQFILPKAKVKVEV
jgi:hypothetical protein